MVYYLAVDIGASSGRHILGHLENGRLVLEEIYRFDNKQIKQNGHDCWDMDNLRNGILEGMKACKAVGKIPKTMGIDTWAVDFVLLDEHDRMIGDAVAYRDTRTAGMDAWVNARIDPAQLYAKTGIQKQPFNTIYQLAALSQEHPEQLQQAASLLMIPEYFNFILTGVKQNEYTNATSTNLVNAVSKTWDDEVIEALGFPKRIFKPLAMPGTVLGNLTPAIQESVGFDTTVVLPATHDTGSAFLAVPAQDDQSVYLSSGTWSLLGVENELPITTPESQAANFTNEGGAWYRYRYLKNIMGLWMIQSVRRELNGIAYVQGKERREKSEKQWSFNDLIQAAREYEHFDSVVDVNDDAFLAPDSMIGAIKEVCAKTNQSVPQTVGEIMQCIYTSLSLCYRDAIRELESLTGKRYHRIHIVGGGCQDMYLNERTARATGLPVYAGPIEGTAIGNLIVQMMADGIFDSLNEARQAIDNVKEIRV